MKGWSITIAIATCALCPAKIDIVQEVRQELFAQFCTENKEIKTQPIESEAKLFFGSEARNSKITENFLTP
jgi:hypothetical protein